MKRKILLISSIFLIMTISASADIIPEPVVVKGIVPLHPVNIQMVSELVKVNLTLDSAFVECTFHMHNFGEQKTLEIGFPVMNFYLWENDYLSPLSKNKFDVIVKGEKISKVDLYIPDQLKTLLSNVDAFQQYNLLRTYNNLEKPWYLWKTHFDKNENLTIVVKYRLPNGATKGNRFFNYLLSTGARWKGKIKDAQVIVNLDNIPTDQVISISPKQNNKLYGKQIAWRFKDLKPTLKNDILIEYEGIKGEYKAFKASLDSMKPYVDGKITKHYSLIDKAAIGDIKIDNDRGIQLYTKAYILTNFKNKLKETNSTLWRQISKLSVHDLENNYSVEINGEKVSNGFLFQKLNKIDSLKIKRIEIRKTKSSKKKMVIFSN